MLRTSPTRARASPAWSPCASAGRGPAEANRGTGTPLRPFEPSHHSKGKDFSLAFSIGPKYVMAELMVDGLHPHPLAFVDTPTFPVLRMHKVDATVLKRSSSGPAPVDVLVPFDPRPLDSIKTAKVRNSLPKRPRAIMVKVCRQFTVDFAALRDWGNEHSHRWILQQRSDNRNSLPY
jgi:hypothetical protein